MSTRSTLWYSDEYHLYQEGLDDNNVYLEVRSPQFESLILRIHLTSLKEMRQHTIQPNERYLDFSADELRAEGEREVDEHRARLDEIRADGRKNTGLRMMFGSFAFGSPDSSREEMIQNFIETYGQRPSDSDSTAGGVAKGQA